jgi:hypothetical protein
MKLMIGKLSHELNMLILTHERLRVNMRSVTQKGTYGKKIAKAHTGKKIAKTGHRQK